MGLKLKYFKLRAKQSKVCAIYLEPFLKNIQVTNLSPHKEVNGHPPFCGEKDR